MSTKEEDNTRRAYCGARGSAPLSRLAIQATALANMTTPTESSHGKADAKVQSAQDKTTEDHEKKRQEATASLVSALKDKDQDAVVKAILAGADVTTKMSCGGSAGPVSLLRVLMDPDQVCNWPELKEPEYKMRLEMFMVAVASPGFDPNYIIPSRARSRSAVRPGTLLLQLAVDLKLKEFAQVLVDAKADVSKVSSKEALDAVLKGE